jgi:hypothetical protein
MCLVFQDNQILSVSRKKLVCHEEMYTNFDPALSQVPKATISELGTKRETISLKQDIQGQPHSDETTDTKVKGVHSIKVLRESTLNESMNEALPLPPQTSHSQLENQGESPSLQKILDADSFLEKINKFKEKTKEDAETQYLKIFEAIQNIRDKNGKLNMPNEEEFGADISAKNILKDRRNLEDRSEEKSGDTIGQ